MALKMKVRIHPQMAETSGTKSDVPFAQISAGLVSVFEFLRKLCSRLQIARFLFVAKNALTVIFAGKHFDLWGGRVHFSPFGGRLEHAAYDFKLAVYAGDH
jgi:hypothetical protein